MQTESEKVQAGESNLHEIKRDKATRHRNVQLHVSMQMHGFSLNAKVKIQAWDRDGLEKLIRYCARPAFASENLLGFARQKNKLRD